MKADFCELRERALVKVGSRTDTFDHSPLQRFEPIHLAGPSKQSCVALLAVSSAALESVVMGSKRLAETWSKDWGSANESPRAGYFRATHGQNHIDVGTAIGRRFRTRLAGSHSSGARRDECPMS
jgi:hypothetical protein